MSHTRSGSRNRLAGATLLAIALFAAACGGESATETAADSADSPSSSTTASTSTTAAATTAAPTTAPATTAAPTTAAPTTTTTEAAGPWEPYKDGSNDCFRNSDYEPAPMCVPPDIDTVTMIRASPLTILFVFQAPVVTADWQLTLGFDIDGDASTGLTEGIWSDIHMIGADLEFDYFADIGDGPFAQIHAVAPGPVFDMLEGGPPDQGPLAIWTRPDDMSLQVVISDTLMPGEISGSTVVGHIMTPDYTDAIPDVGPLASP